MGVSSISALIWKLSQTDIFDESTFLSSRIRDRFPRKTSLVLDLAVAPSEDLVKVVLTSNSCGNLVFCWAVSARRL